MRLRRFLVFFCPHEKFSLSRKSSHISSHPSIHQASIKFIMSTIIGYTMLVRYPRSSFVPRSSILDSRIFAKCRQAQSTPWFGYLSFGSYIGVELLLLRRTMTMFQGRGTRWYPSNQALYFLSRRRTTSSSLSHPISPSSSIHRLDTFSSFSVFCRRLYIALAWGVAAPGNQECILLSSLVFVQEFPVAAAHPLLASTINRFRVVDVPAFGKQCCSLHSRFIVVSLFGSPSSSSSSSRSPPPRPFLRSWLAEPRRGGGRGGFFF